MNRLITPTGAFKAWWSLLMVAVSAVLVAGACIVYTNHVHREGERREQEDRRRSLVMVCAWLTPRVNPLPAPETERGHAQLKADQKLYDYFGCKGVRQ